MGDDRPAAIGRTVAEFPHPAVDKAGIPCRDIGLAGEGDLRMLAERVGLDEINNGFGVHRYDLGDRFDASVGVHNRQGHAV